MTARRPMQLPLPAGSVRVDARGHAVLPATLLDGRRPHIADVATQRARAKSGAKGEDLVARLNAECLAAGIARVRKLPTPMRIVGRVEERGRAVLRCVYSAKSGVDFVGVMLDGSGRHVAVEAKRVASGRVPLARIEEHQRDELAGVHAFGGVAVVLIVHGPRRDVFALPWMLVARAADRGAKSLTTAEMEPYRVLAGRPYLSRWVRR